MAHDVGRALVADAGRRQPEDEPFNQPAVLELEPVREAGVAGQRLERADTRGEVAGLSPAERLQLSRELRWRRRHDLILTSCEPSLSSRRARR